jgi:hypothetical protein
VIGAEVFMTLKYDVKLNLYEKPTAELYVPGIVAIVIAVLFGIPGRTIVPDVGRT